MNDRNLWLVLTPLGFVEIFVAAPRWIPAEDEHSEGHWTGRTIYVLDPLTVKALRFHDYLNVDQPERMQLATADHNQPWKIIIRAANRLEIYADGVQVITFCRRMMRSIRLHELSPGSVRFPVFS